MKCFQAINLLVFLSLSSCNFFFFDDPRGDEQRLSRARACFDRGELGCAIENYLAVEGTELRDRALVELAFAYLAEQGLEIVDFVESFSDGGDGRSLTTLANKVIENAGVTLRMEIYDAYELVTQIQDPELRGMVRFISSLALAAEVLAENGDADGDGTFSSTDLANDPVSCVSNCIPGCPKPANNLTNTGTAVDLTTASRTDVQSNAGNLDLIHGALTEVFNALQNEIGAGGKFGDGIGGFASTINSLPYGTLAANDGACYRANLLSNQVGF